MPENNFKGNPSVNLKLQHEWLDTSIKCDPEEHLEEIIDYIENCSGWLVCNILLESNGKRDPKTPRHCTLRMPSLSGRYPHGWVWIRKASIIN